MLCASLGLFVVRDRPQDGTRERVAARFDLRAVHLLPPTPPMVSWTPYPEGDWRNAALEASLSDEGRLHREGARRNVTYMLKVTYDGEAYSRISVPASGRDGTGRDRERALSKLTGEDRGFLGVGFRAHRHGVHARGQVVHFYARRPLTDLTRARASP